MEHEHRYDAKGNQLCCTQEEKIYAHSHSHEHQQDGLLPLFLPAAFSFILLIAGILMDQWLQPQWFSKEARITWYLIAYLPVGVPVLKDALGSIKQGEVFSEFFLMGIATIGAFAIGEYPEGVAVMLFYAVGEIFQTMAVSRAKTNIQSLLDQRPDEVTIIENNETRIVKAENVEIGEIILLKPGEKLGLDGELLSDKASFNSSALTGESVPETKYKGESVWAGMINLQTVSTVRVNNAYADSKLSKILELVQHATTQKAPTELFIRKFAKIYTPVVVALAVGICFLPQFFVDDYDFQVWLYRALVFLVVSCPCALVISIPLGYFGGIGAASKHGILVKGGNFLDALSTIQHVVMDKTGTMTEGVFHVQEVFMDPSFNREEILSWVNALESYSSHPVATAVHEFVGKPNADISLEQIEEIPGHGMRSLVLGKELLVGNFKLLDRFSVAYDDGPNRHIDTTLAIAYDKKFVGYIRIADRIKEDAAETIAQLHRLQVQTTMLSGDKHSVVKRVAEQLGIDEAYGDLLPEDKVIKIQAIKGKDERVAFVGDGVNDAPVVAWSDVGIAMGGLGSDATIETADVVIQDDRPIKIPMAIRIGKQTKRIVWQNIGFAFGVKAVVLILGAGGLASMWEAVFADVGVALLAILNAMRIQRMRFN